MARSRATGRGRRRATGGKRGAPTSARTRAGRPAPRRRPTAPPPRPDEASASAAPAERPPAPVLTGRQRKALRGQAHRLEPVVHVGREGVTDAVVRAVDEALRAHELIKVRLREPEDKHADADALAAGTAAALCGLVGHTVVLYRPHPERPKITP